ncbi:MAG TPA: hypothetical protein VNX01_02830 [Bacteroidia bacterium]|jgi:hypothetical protein|nr:hypothetical protein [Bacteroidia bacterium]
MNKQTIINIVAVITGLTLVALNNVMGHYNPPFSITYTPFIMTIIIAGINYSLYKADFSATVFYSFSLLLVNDFLIRTYAGGDHDQEGKGWISMFFAITYILSVISMLIYSVAISTDNKATKSNIWVVLTGAVMTVFLYIGLLSNI